jgi:hypothetical protein
MSSAASTQEKTKPQEQAVVRWSSASPFAGLEMPAPVAFAVPGAMAAAKHMALQASIYVDVTTFTSATFAAILSQWLWKKLPFWIKEDISFRNLLGNKDEVTREELSHLGSVVDKLQELARSAKDVDAAIPQLHAAVLAFIQLSGQIKLAQSKVEEPLTRDFMYKSSGKPFPMRRLQSPEFQDTLNFATWAYYDDSQLLQDKLDQFDYTLLSHNLASRPGNVAYFLAVSPQQKQLLVGVRGTSTIEELITDCCGRAVPLEEDSEDDAFRIEVQVAMPNSVHLAEDGEVEVISGHERIMLENHDDEGDNFVRCHEGILISSRKMVNKIEPLIVDLIQECGYSVMLCGHSLGAGAATLAGLILRSRFPELAVDNQRLQVYAFAPPPVLDHDSAIAAASFCTSVVNNADVIPRCSLYNLQVFLECLRKVQQRLVKEEMNPTGPVSTAAFITMLSQGTSGSLLMTVEEWNETVRVAHDRIALRKPEHLYIPGRVILLYNPWVGEDDDEDDDEYLTWICTETDGTAAVFRTLEVDGARLFTDHVTSSYFEALGMEYDF